MDIATVVGDSGRILRTTDRGIIWSNQASGVQRALLSVSFADANHGITVGGAVIGGGAGRRTTDGGASWTDPFPIPAFGMFAVSFPELNSAATVGVRFLKSTDQGYTWTEQNRPTIATFNSVSFPDANHGTAVGSGGTIVHTDVGGEVTSVEEIDDETPRTALLFQNFPNPFNPGTTIMFSLGLVSDVTLKIYDILGREVTTLISGRFGPGEHTTSWNATGVPSGVYFFRLVAGEIVETRKLVIVR
jgi:hypothetical protein